MTHCPHSTICIRTYLFFGITKIRFVFSTAEKCRSSKPLQILFSDHICNTNPSTISHSLFLSLYLCLYLYLYLSLCLFLVILFLFIVRLLIYYPTPYTLFIIHCFLVPKFYVFYPACQPKARNLINLFIFTINLLSSRSHS